MRIYVLDSTAIFQKKAVYENMVTVPEVVSEILDENSSLYLSVKGLKVEDASERSLKIVMETSKKTGDIYKLSNTDLKLLAKALDEKEKGNEVVLVTDDYSIQNVAMALGIEFEGVIQRGISKGFKWVRVCRGCGRKVDSAICPICGCETMVRKVKK
ncbi:MAG: NOB1 family endonuclease [Archaeoglobaceae archaeon]|nr:NOB1 family endonuclease [Archaeoglobaceae archaeon]